MNGRKCRPSRQELEEQARQLCGEGPHGAQVWLKLDRGDFEPFFRAEEARLWESPVLTAAEAPAWVRRVVEELPAGRAVTRFLLHIGSSSQVLSLEELAEIASSAERAVDIGGASFVLGYRAMEALKKGEVTLVVLAAVEAEPPA